MDGNIPTDQPSSMATSQVGCTRPLLTSLQTAPKQDKTSRGTPSHLLQLICKPHLEQPVCLIKHEVLAGAQAHALHLLQVVHQAACGGGLRGRRQRVARFNRQLGTAQCAARSRLVQAQPLHSSRQADQTIRRSVKQQWGSHMHPPGVATRMSGNAASSANWASMLSPPTSTAAREEGGV